MTNERKILPFGIGCIYFVLNDLGNPPWKDAVLSTLSSIPGVSDVEIDLGVVLPQEASAGTGYYPTRGMLRFRLHIPVDVQRGFDLPPSLLGISEDFVVMVYFRYFEPVTFVICHGSDSASDAMSGVLVTARYLESQFSEQDYPVDLRIVDPTPFHAEPCVKPGRIKEGFKLSRVASRRGEELSFQYSKTDYPSPEMAAVHLFASISEELSLYYSLIARQEDRRKQNFEITTLTQALIYIYQDSNLKARLLRVITSSAKIRRVALKAALQEYRAQDDERVARREIQELYSTGIAPYFKDFIEGEVSSDYTSQISAAKEVVSLLDQARQRQVELTSLFFSAVAGGLAGALVSLLIR